MQKRSALQASAGVLTAVFFLAACGKKPFKMPLVDVGIVVVQRQDMPASIEWVATTDGFINAQIRAQVSGNLLSYNFKEGSLVRKGDLLFRIDSRPFQAAYDAAKARYDKAARDKERYVPLAAESAISKQELDQAISAYEQTKADMESARLELEFTTITSPINGIAGLAKAQVGDLVGPNTGELTSVVQVDPIKVYFSLSEQQYLNYVKEHAASGKSAADLYFELMLADNTVFPRKGRFFSADNKVDPNTGTIRVTLVFPNPGNVLRPGQFGRVRHQEVLKGVLAIPQEAVIEAQGKHQAAVVDDANVVRMRPIEVGENVGRWTVVAGGLRPGERVVAEGVMKAQDGATVNPKPLAAAPSSGPAAR